MTVMIITIVLLCVACVVVVQAPSVLGIRPMPSRVVPAGAPPAAAPGGAHPAPAPQPRKQVTLEDLPDGTLFSAAQEAATWALETKQCIVSIVANRCPFARRQMALFSLHHGAKEAGQPQWRLLSEDDLRDAPSVAAGWGVKDMSRFGVPTHFFFHPGQAPKRVPGLMPLDNLFRAFSDAAPAVAVEEIE